MKKTKMYMIFMLWMTSLLAPGSSGEAGNTAIENVPLSPMPQWWDRQEKNFQMTSSVNLIGKENADAATVDHLINFLTAEKIVINEHENATAVSILLRTIPDQSSESEMIKRKHQAKPEGYLLVINQDGAAGRIIIEGNDQNGLFYGVQTLKQLLRAGNLTNMRIEDYPELKARGTIEGFYGTPWTHEDRLDQLRFYGAYKLNTYIYAPKDDPYHRIKWREPYPESEMVRMQELIITAQQNKVDFVFAISPGVDIAFNGIAGENDFTVLLAKFESLYAMGVRSFAVYYDDIADKNAAKQAKVLNRLQSEFVKKKSDVKPLLTVPTEYFTVDMAPGYGELKPYTKEFAAALDREIGVMYTGPEVVCMGISAADNAFVSRIYDRKMAIWWNYPVTDYFLDKLALGPISGLDAELGKYMDYFVMNPMEHAKLSKIAVQTGAEYAWSPQKYQAQAAWQRAIIMQYGELADDMQIFADHSARMDYNWAQAGRDDAPQMRQSMDCLWKKLSVGENADQEIAKLQQAFQRMESAAAQLIENLPDEILAECRPQLKLFGELAYDDQIALQMVEAKLAGDSKAYQILRKQTKKNQQRIAREKIKISEKVAMRFLTECLDFGEK